MSSSGDITRCVLPFRHGVSSFNSTYPAALHRTRSSDRERRSGDVAAQLFQPLAVVCFAAHRGMLHCRRRCRRTGGWLGGDSRGPGMQALARAAYTRLER